MNDTLPTKNNRVGKLSEREQEIVMAEELLKEALADAKRVGIIALVYVPDKNVTVMVYKGDLHA